jgi:hypothetical protein
MPRRQSGIYRPDDADQKRLQATAAEAGNIAAFHLMNECSRTERRSEAA